MVMSTREEQTLAIPIGQMSVLDDLVRQLEELFRSARNMPFSSSALVDRQSVLDIVEMLKRSIPEEIARARGVIRDRDEILERAQAQGQRVVDRAQAHREQLLSQTEIIQSATEEARRVVEDAQHTAQRIRVEAERYVEGKLATFEVVLQRTLAAVERGRSRLAGRVDADDLADEAVPEEF